MQEPEIVLADEPIASLDPRNTRVVMDALQRINRHHGITVLCNLHSLDLARGYCDRLIGMAAGRVVFDGASQARRSFAPHRFPTTLSRNGAANRGGFPLGVDLILAAGAKLACLPRSVVISGEARLMYVAVKGGERAIANAHALLADERRGDRAIPEISPAQIDQQLALAVDRVMSEGSLYDRELAALAIKQARGDLIEAIFLVRAYRTTLPRFGFAEPVDTGAMALRRRVSGDLQGSAGRPGARADLRLHPPPDRLFARRGRRAGAGADGARRRRGRRCRASPTSSPATT